MQNNSSQVQQPPQNLVSQQQQSPSQAFLATQGISDQTSGSFPLNHEIMDFACTLDMSSDPFWYLDSEASHFVTTNPSNLDIY